MNSQSFLLLGGVILVLLVGAFAPLKRGSQINCDDGIKTRMILTGLPRAYRIESGNPALICVDSEHSLHDSDAKIVSSAFMPWALGVDILVDSLIIFTMYYVMKSKRVRA
jgi:hypothetical protein